MDGAESFDRAPSWLDRRNIMEASHDIALGRGEEGGVVFLRLGVLLDGRIGMDSAFSFVATEVERPASLLSLNRLEPFIELNHQKKT